MLGWVWRILGGIFVGVFDMRLGGFKVIKLKPSIMTDTRNNLIVCKRARRSPPNCYAV